MRKLATFYSMKAAIAKAAELNEKIDNPVIEYCWAPIRIKHQDFDQIVLKKYYPAGFGAEMYFVND